MTEFQSGSNQRVPEFHSWVCLCKGMETKSYVELGCGSAHWLTQAGVTKVITVDILPNGLRNVPHIQGDSHDPHTLDRVLYILGDAPDVVFIDADHEAAAVQKDFELWWPVARMMVGFHDIRMPSVIPFWQDIRLKYPSIEIIARDVESANAWQHPGPHPDGLVNCGGIGVLFKK
jgi:hypothetical protein